MPKNTSVSLSDRNLAFAQRQIASGRYATVSEVIRNALVREEERVAHLAALRAAIAEGEASGPAHDFDFDAWMANRFG